MTRARGPAGREPIGGGPSRPHADDRETAVLPPVHPAPRAAPAVPEVPAIADLAAPGRPAVDAVVTPEAPPARRRPRPSRRMRARADEMVRVLSPTGRPPRAPTTGRAAAAVMAAVAVGGVGIALGLDAQRTGQQLALPEIPDVPAEQTPVDTGPVGAGGTTPTAGTSLLDTADDGVGAEGDVARRTAEPSAAAAPRATRGAPDTTARPRATTPSRADDPTSSTSTPRSTTSVRPSTRADEPDDPDDPAPRDRRDTVGSRGLGDPRPGSGSEEDEATAG